MFDLENEWYFHPPKYFLLLFWIKTFNIKTQNNFHPNEIFLCHFPRSLFLGCSLLRLSCDWDPREDDIRWPVPPPVPDSSMPTDSLWHWLDLLKTGVFLLFWWWWTPFSSLGPGVKLLILFLIRGCMKISCFCVSKSLLKQSNVSLDFWRHPYGSLETCKQNNAYNKNKNLYADLNLRWTFSTWFFKLRWYQVPTI